MGWSLRKSFKLGFMRVNLSSRGIGYSVGARGMRVGTDAQGRPFLRAGRGPLRYQTSIGAKSKTTETVEFVSSPSLPTSLPSGSFGAGGLIALAVLLAAIAVAWRATDEDPAGETSLLVVPILLSGVFLFFLIWSGRRAKKRRESLTAYVDAAQALIANPRPTEREAASVHRLRGAVLVPIPETLPSQFETAYRQAIADAVADQVITPDEERRIKTLAKGLDLSREAVIRANLNGFLQGFAAVVADHNLTLEEEQKLVVLQRNLGVSEEAVRAQLTLVDQLRRARQVGEEPLAPAEIGAKLRKGEECYHATPVREMKERVARSWVQDGERFTEKELKDFRTGTLYVTNQRLLIVADGTTNIKTASILEASVDAPANNDRFVKLVVDGRKTPLFLGVPEPYVVLAYVERVWALA